MSTGMLDRIRACISALPPAEQRVAKLVLADARLPTREQEVRTRRRRRVARHDDGVVQERHAFHPCS